MQKNGILSLIFLCACFFQNICSVSDASTKKLYVIEVSGTVDPGLAAYLKRSIETISHEPESVLLLELNTYGGRVDSAIQIADALLTLPKGKTIAYVSEKAISAGALIALACSQIVMKYHTTIGDCAPIMYSNEGPKMMGEKFQSPLRAKFRSLAKRNGYPERLSEAMITAELEVYLIEMDGKKIYIDAQEYEDLTANEKQKITLKKTIVKKDELLTMDNIEAHEYGFSKMSVSGFDEMIDKMGFKEYEIIRLQESWSETFVRLIETISPFLLMIGLTALYLEMKSPGFGILGIVGIVCIALVFFNQYLVGLANYTELLILTVGILLLGIEFFVIPGFGITGIMGIVCIAIALIFAFQDFVIPNPSLPWEKELLLRNIVWVFGSFVGAFICALIIFRFIFPRLSIAMREGPFLTGNLQIARADSSEIQKIGVGSTGVAITFLRPSGKMKIDQEIIDVVAEGEFIEKGAPITVMDIRGNRVIVRRKTEKENKGFIND